MIDRVKFVNILLLTAFCLMAKSIMPAQEVQIMIAGPWSFVEDPADKSRLVIVAPNEPNHYSPALFSGGDIMHPSNSLSTPTFGNYRIDVYNISACTNSATNDTSFFRLMNIDVANVISPMIKGPSARFAFSLPKPCYWTDVKAKRMKSRIQVNTLPSTSTAEGPYTTWTILHYSVSQVQPVLLSGTSDDKSISYKSNIDLTARPGAIPSMSILMYGPENESYPNDCDPVSVRSVHMAGALFKAGIHVWQPSIDAYGDQWIYKPLCIDDEGDMKTIQITKTTTDLLTMVIQVERTSRQADETELRKGLATLKEIEKKFMDFAETQHLGRNAGFVKMQESEFTKAEYRLKHLIETVHEKHDNSFDQNLDEPLLPHATATLFMFTPGSGDCRGAQLAVNDIIP